MLFEILVSFLNLLSPLSFLDVSYPSAQKVFVSRVYSSEHQIKKKKEGFVSHLTDVIPEFPTAHELWVRNVMHLNVLKETMNNSTRYFKTQVTLSPESNPETPVFTTPVSVASYFQFPSVPNDGQVYIVRLESSLSSLNYQYIRPESTVTATGVRAHVTFKFEPQVWRASQFVYIPDVNCYSHLLSQIHQSFREMLYFIDALFFFIIDDLFLFRFF